MSTVIAADLVAIGTLTLAFVTLFVAIPAGAQVWLTRKILGATERSVAASEQAVEVANRQFAASLRPIVVDVPVGIYRQAEEIVFTGFGPRKEAIAQDRGEVVERINKEEGTRLLSVPVRNLGPCTAVVSTPLPTVSVVRAGARHQGRSSHTVMPVGELSRLNFGIPTTLPGHQFYVEIAYRDIAGDQMTRTQLFVTRRKEDEPLRVTGIALYSGVKEQPSVVSGEGFG